MTVRVLTTINPRLTCELSDGRDMRLAASRADLFAITGSALSNGIMDDLLSLPGRPRPVTVVQGQSAAIHPTPLFRRGATIVVSCVKPFEMVEVAKRSPGQASLQHFTENRREWMPSFRLETATAIRNRFAGEQFSERPAMILHVDMSQQFTKAGSR